jgi:hypothetical protein
MASYVNTANPPANTGLLWKGGPGGNKVPLSGWGSNLFYYNPRLGFAYDVFGTGKTVVRGGFGTYRYQVSNNDGGTAMGGPLGVFTVSSGARESTDSTAITSPAESLSQGPGYGAPQRHPLS